MDEDDNDWAGWFQDVAKTVVTSATQAKFQQPYEVEKLKLQAFSQYGMPYIEGKPVQAAMGPSHIAGIPTAWLLIGGVIALVVMVND